MIGQITGDSRPAISVQDNIRWSPQVRIMVRAPLQKSARRSSIILECAYRCGARNAACLLLLGRLRHRLAPPRGLHSRSLCSPGLDAEPEHGTGLLASAPLRSALGRTRRMMIFDGDDGFHGGPTGARRRGGVCALGAGPGHGRSLERLPEAELGLRLRGRYCHAMMASAPGRSLVRRHHDKPPVLPMILSSHGLGLASIHQSGASNPMTT
jgi:hypothetical protein